MINIRRNFVLTITLVALGILACNSCRKQPEPATNFNVLLISIDTCRPDYFSCYGYPQKTTPHIDNLAEEGILFSHAISPVPITLPAHSSMLTGTNPIYHGVHDNSVYALGDSNTTLAEVLKENGFTTGAIISAFVLDGQYGLSRGFDSYDDTFDQETNSVGVVERVGEEATDHATSWIEEHQSEPFFLFLHYYDPHLEHTPPEPFASRFADVPYAGEIAYTDECIGQVIQHLKKLDLYDSTLIIITSDHGEMLGEHGELSHAYFIYESAIRVPLIVKLPGRKEATRVPDLVGIIDIMPTVCGLLDIPPPLEIAGTSLTPFLTGHRSADDERAVFCESLTPTKYGASSLLGVATPRWKYIHTARPELYDVVQDPGEGHDLALQQPEVVARLQQELEAIWAKQHRVDAATELESQEEMINRLRSLGYVGGSVSEDFDLLRTEDKEDPKDLIELHVNHCKVMLWYHQGKLAEASNLCRQMLSQHEYCEGHLYMAKILLEQKEYSRAADQCRKAIELDPARMRAHTNLGEALIGMGQFDEAIDHYREAMQLGPDFAEPAYNLANGLQLQGKYEEAVSYYRRALKIRPHYAKAHNNLAGALQQLGQHEQAIQEFRLAIEAKPDYAFAHNNLGVALVRQGEIDEAITHFRAAVESDPNFAEPRKNLDYALRLKAQR